MPMKKYLFLTLLSFALLPSLFIGMFSYSYVSRRLTAQAGNAALSLAASNGSLLKSILEDQESVLDSLASSMLARELLEASQSRPISRQDKEYLEMYPLLVKLANKSSACQKISIYNANGQVVASSDQSFLGAVQGALPQLPYNGSEATVTSELSRPEDGGLYCIDIVKPCYQGSSLLGYAAATLDISYLIHSMRSAHLKDECDILIVGSDGKIIYHTNGKYRSEALDASAFSKLKLLWFDDEKGYFALDYDGADCIFGYDTIEGPNWFLLTQQRLSFVHAVSCSILFATASCITIVMIFSSSFALYYFNRFSRHLSQINAAIRQVSNGNFNVHCQAALADFEELFKSFNQMAQNLKSTYDDLASMRELLASNEKKLISSHSKSQSFSAHDPLTWLPSRLAFYEKAEAALNGKSSQGLGHAFFFIGLDNFQTESSSLEPEYGHELLRLSAKRLKALATEERDSIARIGVGQFLIFKYNTSKEQAEALAKTVLDGFQMAFSVKGQMISIHLSIGISLYPEHGATQLLLVENADMAMRCSKESGQNCSCFFDPSMGSATKLGEDILDALKNAISGRNILLMCQPQIDMASHEIIGFEPLIQIQSDKLGLLSPSEYAPVAEAAGLVGELSRWALKESCRFNQSLISSGYSPICVWASVSPAQLSQPSFISNVKSILEETGLDPKYLKLIVKESGLPSPSHGAAAWAGKLQELGVGISPNCFGAGGEEQPGSIQSYLFSKPLLPETLESLLGAPLND